MKALATFVCLALAVSLASCQQGKSASDSLHPLNEGTKQDLTNEVAELRSMREELHSAWDGIEGRVATVEVEVEQFSPNALAVAGVDLSPLADDILHGGPVSVVSASSVKSTPMGVSNPYKDTSEETRTEILRVQEQGHRLMAELHQGLPSGLQGLVVQAAATTTSALLIQKKAEQMAPVAEKDLPKTADQQSEYTSDMRILESEVAELNQLADQISRESGGLTDRVTRAATTFQTKVSAFGANR